MSQSSACRGQRARMMNHLRNYSSNNIFALGGRGVIARVQHCRCWKGYYWRPRPRRAPSWCGGVGTMGAGAGAGAGRTGGRRRAQQLQVELQLEQLRLAELGGCLQRVDECLPAKQDSALDQELCCPPLRALCLYSLLCLVASKDCSTCSMSLPLVPHSGWLGLGVAFEECVGEHEICQRSTRLSEIDSYGRLLETLLVNSQGGTHCFNGSDLRTTVRL